MAAKTYEMVEIWGTKYSTDKNGFRMKKTRRFSQTINPLNVIEDGTPKSKEEKREWMLSWDR